MFRRIAIANRGEIACRVIRTARRLGIATLAVYSEADEQAKHVEMADDAVCIGPAPSAESYLAIDRIVEAVKAAEADAVHPGYGFLSENAAFSDALAAAGIVFIGPPSTAIAAMGDKIESKKLSKEAGVNTIPGHPDAVADAKEAGKIADKVGFPVMIKASAGGGGKGMRIARSAKEVSEGFTSAASEAQTSFGDDRVFIEKFIEEPRHIEIQILADQHGNVVHLGERECSIQRRHQKVVEEAPSPFVNDELRKEMGAQAVRLARAVAYQSAGTVEFIVDRDRNFYFLEMNTRLQVEHPVTECVTGLDLVEQMIRIAAGEPLGFGQNDITLDGWAVETRIYAEDPLRNFMPSTGRLSSFQPPKENDGVRIDAGVAEGGQVSMFYDPMIAKMITSGASREEAVDGMRAALDAFRIRGVENNIAFLAAIVRHPLFVAGDLTTDFIDQAFPGGFSEAFLEPGDWELFAAIAAVIDRLVRLRNTTGHSHCIAFFGADDRDGVALAVEALDEDVWSVQIGDAGDAKGAGGRALTLQIKWRPGDGILEGIVDGNRVTMQVDPSKIGYVLGCGGRRADIRTVDAHVGSLQRRMPVKVAPDMSRFLLSPMPGLLMRVAVAAGDAVKPGQELAVVEAMKMENVLRAIQDRVVKEVHAEEGAALFVDQKILEFE